MPRVLLTLVTVLVALPCLASLPVESAVEQAIRNVSGAHIAAIDLIETVYERREFAPAWNEPEQVQALLDAVRGSHDEGLNPTDYRLAVIEKVRETLLTGHQFPADEQAEWELLLTDSLIRLLHDSVYGKVDPETHQATRDFGRPLNGRNPSAVVAELIGAGNLDEAISSVTPRDTDYDRLKTQLKQHRLMAAAGGWPEVPSGPTIHPDANDSRLEILATRLLISGDLVEGHTRTKAATYDVVLQDAVRHFQKRHGLKVDGVVGPATLRALNVPIEQRIDQIRVNLERARWRRNYQIDNLVVVNIAGFRMYVYRDEKIVTAMKVIVGAEEDRTPLFHATITHVVFNPAWTVPYSIASEEILPSIKKDANHLEKNGYRLFDRDGNVVDPSAVDWSAIHVRNFPFTIVQQPGPANQLGQVKFMFPNQDSVCMHDTPARSLFTQARRALSHGCIRVDDPIKLAEVLLGAEGWTRTQIDAEIESKKTKTIMLENPVALAVLYWTAEVNEQGEIQFFDDIYDRDAALLRSLDSP